MNVVHMFERIISLENLFCAWREFLNGKRERVDVQEFERGRERNILELRNALVGGTYRHGPYTKFHIFDPKHRLIHKASVRDRFRVFFIFEGAITILVNVGRHDMYHRLSAFS